MAAVKKEKAATATATKKKLKRPSLKSPFELNKEQKKLITSTKPKAKTGTHAATGTEKKKVSHQVFIDIE